MRRVKLACVVEIDPRQVLDGISQYVFFRICRRYGHLNTDIVADESPCTTWSADQKRDEEVKGL